MQARAFNTIFVDYPQGLLTKSSENHAKLKNEIHYYLNLPPKIADFFPRLVTHDKEYKSYTLEYIPYLDLATLCLQGAINFDEGKDVLNKLWTILNTIHFYKPTICTEASPIYNFYINKTVERIDLLNTDKAFEGLTGSSTVRINGKTYKTFSNLKRKFIERVKSFITHQAPVTLIHGDFCLSNILYCPTLKDIKLIDPRGAFGSQGIYGHPYYDYAKLLHCFHGQYDNILKKEYIYRELDSKNYELTIPTSPLFQKMHQQYRDVLRKQGIDLDLLYLIEASLFLSMTPLHYECKERQKVLFLQGLIILNNYFRGNYENMY